MIKSINGTYEVRISDERARFFHFGMTTNYTYEVYVRGPASDSRLQKYI